MVNANVIFKGLLNVEVADNERIKFWEGAFHY